MSGKFLSTKTYGHELGLSAVFRQHRATHSHCSLLHGYALAFKITFECDNLDDRNWVQDFGGLKVLKERIQASFDHKLVAAEDDPAIDYLTSLAGLGLADVLVLPAVGCEAFAQYVFGLAQAVVTAECRKEVVNTHGPDVGNWPVDRYRVRVHSVECMEHGANSAIYVRA